MMKKLTAMVMVILVMLAMCASAELTYKTAGTERYEIGVNRKGEKVVDMIYYLQIESESGQSVKLEVTEEEYNKVAKAERDAEKSFWQKAATTATFWNPND